MARMKYEIILAPEAAQDLKRLKAHTRSEVKDALERHLRHEPGRVSHEEGRIAQHEGRLFRISLENI